MNSFKLSSQHNITLSSIKDTTMKEAEEAGRDLLRTAFLVCSIQMDDWSAKSSWACWEYSSSIYTFRYTQTDVSNNVRGATAAAAAYDVINVGWLMTCLQQEMRLIQALILVSSKTSKLLYLKNIRTIVISDSWSHPPILSNLSTYRTLMRLGNCAMAPIMLWSHN